MAGPETSLNGTEVGTITELKVEVLTAETGSEAEDAAKTATELTESLVDSTQPT